MLIIGLFILRHCVCDDVVWCAIEGSTHCFGVDGGQAPEAWTVSSNWEGWERLSWAMEVLVNSFVISRLVGSPGGDDNKALAWLCKAVFGKIHDLPSYRVAKTGQSLDQVVQEDRVHSL